jgi:hypothetical protein
MAKAMDSKITSQHAQSFEEPVSIADLFMQANRELAKSDARIYRAADKYIKATRELLRQEQLRQDVRPVLDNAITTVALEYGYERQTRKSLEELCKKHSIRGFSRMSKEQMIICLQEKEIPEPPIPLEAYSKMELVAFLRDVLGAQSHVG